MIARYTVGKTVSKKRRYKVEDRQLERSGVRKLWSGGWLDEGKVGEGVEKQLLSPNLSAKCCCCCSSCR